MEEALGPCKRKPTAVDPDNAEAVRLQQVNNRKKQCLTQRTVQPNASTPTISAPAAGPSKAASQQPSIEEVNDEDELRLLNRPKPSNKAVLIESSDDDNEIEITQPRKKKTATQHKSASSPPLLASEDVPKQPEESYEAELSEFDA